MKNKLFGTLVLLLITNSIHSQSLNDSKVLVKNEKMEEFTVTVLKGKDNFEAIVEIQKNGEIKPIISFYAKGQSYEFTNLKSANGIVSFEDFNFDGENEIVIQSNDGIYLFDRKTGKPKNLFEKEKDRESNKIVQNYIFTYRGEYEKNNEEKTLKITGSNSAFSGSEIVYRADQNGKMKVVKRCDWDYGQ